MLLFVVNVTGYEHCVGSFILASFALSHLGVVAFKAVDVDAYAVLIVHVGIGNYVVVALKRLLVVQYAFF